MVGAAVRCIYTKPKDKPIRQNPENWIGSYKQGALAANNSRTKALEAFLTIPQIGGSTATRHLLFWGGHPPMSAALQALVFRQDEKVDYEEFVSKLVKLAKTWDVDFLYAERALYGLTEFYGDLKTLDIYDFQRQRQRLRRRQGIVTRQNKENWGSRDKVFCLKFIHHREERVLCKLSVTSF